ncbi:MAG TPA: hypothetical protein DC049_14150, partial [Spirochaetia bacterium]|nr:hypothetical protein [Spirochaetia bacterium]
DHRAATPSQAAEIISRSKYQAARMLPEIRNRLLKAMDRLYSECNLRFSALSTERIIKILEYRTAQLSLQNDDLRRRTDTALHQIYEDKKQFFLQSLAKLDALSPQKVLERGYSVVYKNKKIIKNAAELAAGDLVELRLAQGTSAAEIQ